MYLLGDLNFRIRGDFSNEGIVRLIEKGRHLTLLGHDELTTLRAPYSHRNNAGFSSTMWHGDGYDDGSLFSEQIGRTNTDPLTHSRMSSQPVSPISRSRTEQMASSKKKKRRMHSADITGAYEETMSFFKKSTKPPPDPVPDGKTVDIRKFKKDSLAIPQQLSFIDGM